MAGYSVPLSRWFYQGQVSPGAKVYVYLSQTTTLQTIYSDGDLSTPLANPVTCDSNGEAVFYVGDNLPLRLYVTTSSGTLIRDIDPVYPYPGQYMTNATPGVATSNAFVILGPSRNLDRLDVAALTGNGVFLFPSPGGRLTLTSNTPVTASDVTAATTVYYTPYTGASLPIYNAGQWKLLSSTQDSLALDSDSGHTGYHQSGKNFDVFATLTGTNTLRIGTGPAWSSDTSRGTGAGTTELEMLNGVLVNKNDMTLRHGNASGNTSTITAREATYLGTIRCTANGQTEDSLVKRFVANQYNRVVRPLRNTFTTTRATTSASFVELNSEIRIEFLSSGDETLMMTANGSIGISATQVAATSIGIDDATAESTISAAQAYTASATVPFSVTHNSVQGAGYHYATLLGNVTGGATATWAAASALTAAVRM